MAKVAAQTGIAPQFLADLDADVWVALVHAVDTRWGQVEEMLTFQAELLHELIRHHSARPLPPLHLPRPGDLLEQRQRPVSMADQVADLAAQFGGVVVNHG
jgi:hypothetical protein